MPLLSPLGSVTCPHCFAVFHLSHAPRRSMRRDAPREPCALVGAHFGSTVPPILPKIDRSQLGGGFWRRAGRRFYLPPEDTDFRTVCPKCGIYLPDKIANGELSSEVIAIVGARSSGKSNYFGVLLHDLRRRLGGQVGFEMVDAMTYTPSKGLVSSSVLYQERYGRLYDSNEPRAVAQTLSATTEFGKDTDPRIPLIYQIRFRKHSWQHVTHPLAVRVPVYLLIFDAAGEDMVDETILEQYYSFLERATGIVFLIDPFEYAGVRRQLPPDVQKQLKPVGAEPSWVVDHVLNTIRKRKRLASGRSLDIPASFVLTKSDLFQKIPGVVHKNSALGREGVHNGGYDILGGEDLSREVQQHITNWDSRELVDKAQANFKTYSFFAVSALGASPAPDLRLEHPPQPCRVGDPLLWLFWQRGYIRGIRRV
ncbi:MAG TPA: hypothetical protein PLV92_06480 [Pirellulaceae bacterium]|nr:hypothetical protein [Pirellulaceae bacterium]